MPKKKITKARLVSRNRSRVHTAKARATKPKPRPKAKPIRKAGKARKVARRPSPKTRKSKPRKWTFTRLKRLNRKFGSGGLQHKDRKYDPRIHQGRGGVFFVFQQDGTPGFVVREIYVEGAWKGHTTGFHGNRYFDTKKEAHAAAELSANTKLPIT